MERFLEAPTPVVPSSDSAAEEKASNSPKKSKDTVLLPCGLPRLSRDFGATVGVCSSTTTTFDSEGNSVRGHPLPKPSMPSSATDDHGVGFGFGSASRSVSSVGSSGSSEDNAQFGGAYVLKLV